MKWYWLIALLIIVLSSACTTDNTVLPTLAVLPTVTPIVSPIPTLQAWQSQQGMFLADDSVEEWQFMGESGTTIRLAAIQRSAKVTLTLLLGGVVVAQGESIVTRLPASAIYHVRLQAERAGNYEIGLSYPEQENPHAPTPLPQVVGIPTPTPAYNNLGSFIQQFNGTTEVTGILDAQNPQHVYTFMGTSGAVISVDFSRIAGTLDPFITLYNPEGQPLAMDDDSAGEQNARLRNIRLNQDGLYSLQVHGSGFYGDYVLYFLEGGLSLSPDSQATLTPTSIAPYVTPVLLPVINDARLVAYEPVIGNLPRAGDFQRFSIYAEAGDSLTIRAMPYQSSGISPQIEIFNADGELIHTARASLSGIPQTAIAANLPIAVTGTHILIVTGEDNTFGAYTLAYGKGASVEAVFRGEALSNQTITGTIDQAASHDVWRLPLNPNDSISIAVSPNHPNFDPVIELVTADGVVLSRDDNSGGANQAALLRTVTVMQPADYLLRVYDANGTGRGGYTLLWRYITAAPSPTPPAPAATILSISDEVRLNQYHFYVFQGQAGQRIRVKVEAANTSLDPVAALLDPQGTVIAEVDDFGGTLNPEFDFVLPQDGTYSVRVNGYLSSGAFELSVAILL